MNKKIANVGMAKGGWGVSYKHFSGKNPPKWIARHAKVGRTGLTIDNLKEPNDPSVLMRNTAPWAENPERAVRTLNTVFKRRAKAIEQKIANAHLASIRSRLRFLKKRGVR